MQRSRCTPLLLPAIRAGISSASPADRVFQHGTRFLDETLDSWPDQYLRRLCKPSGSPPWKAELAVHHISLSFASVERGCGFGGQAHATKAQHGHIDCCKIMGHGMPRCSRCCDAMKAGARLLQCPGPRPNLVQVCPVCAARTIRGRPRRPAHLWRAAALPTRSATCA